MSKRVQLTNARRSEIMEWAVDAFCPPVAETQAVTEALAAINRKIADEVAKVSAEELRTLRKYHAAYQARDALLCAPREGYQRSEAPLVPIGWGVAPDVLWDYSDNGRALHRGVRRVGVRLTSPGTILVPECWRYDSNHNASATFPQLRATPEAVAWFQARHEWCEAVKQQLNHFAVALQSVRMCDELPQIHPDIPERFTRPQPTAIVALHGVNLAAVRAIVVRADVPAEAS